LCLLTALACSTETDSDRPPDAARKTSALGGKIQEAAHYRVLVRPQFDQVGEGFGVPALHDPERKQFLAVDPDTLTMDSRGWSLSAPAPGISTAPFGYPQVYDARHKRALRFVDQDLWAWDGSRWTVSEPKGPKPPARSIALVMYDPDRERVLLYGGLSRLGAALDDTWLWDGSEWTEVASATKPTLRSLAAQDYQAVYDFERKCTVLVVPNGNYFETYLFDGTKWTLASTPSPPFRSEFALVWDGATRSALLFGGTSTFGVDQNDAWRWDGTKWTDVTPAVSPPARAVRTAGRLEYDPVRGNVVLVAGLSRERNALLEDTWIWSGTTTTWTEVAKNAPHPSPRWRAIIGYDPERKGIVVSGGFPDSVSRIPLFDTWLWDGSNWIQSSVFTAPSTRSAASFVDLPASSTSLLFGGNDGTSGSALGDTWLWDGLRWTTSTVSPAPPARWDASIVYDSKRSLALLFGGRAANDQVRGDSWTWANSKWTAVTGAQPPARHGANLVFDDTNARAVLFGGFDQSDAPVATNWKWSGTTWSALTGPQPPVRGGAGLVHDPKRRNVVLFGGRSGTTADSVLGDTWLLDGDTWTQVDGTPSPPARVSMQMAFDPARENVVLFGGFAIDPVTGSRTFFDDTWTWDGSSWSLSSSFGPSARANAQFVFDSDRQRLVLVAGEDGSHSLNDTWAWNGAEWIEEVSDRLTPMGPGTSAIYDPRKKELVVVPDTVIPTSVGTYRDLTYLLSPYGAACTSESDCPSGSCVDGVCCLDAACSSCERCNDPSRSGVCRTVTNAHDPDSCDGTSTCNAQGACRLQIGSACTSSLSCASSFCVDGVCCEKRCDGQCEACGEPGSEGRCQPIRGKPRGERPDCEGADVSIGADASIGSLCGRPACNGGSTTPLVGDRCQGTIGPCAPFACSLEGCRERCASDGDCDPAAFCDLVIGSCRPRLTCDGDHTLMAEGLTSQSCEPYRCEPGGGCKARCSSVADCVAPSECSREGRCVAPLTTSNDGSCSVGSRPARGPGGAAALSILALLFFTRRRLRAAGGARTIRNGSAHARIVVPGVIAAVLSGCSTGSSAPAPVPGAAETVTLATTIAAGDAAIASRLRQLEAPAFARIEGGAFETRAIQGRRSARQLHVRAPKAASEPLRIGFLGPPSRTLELIAKVEGNVGGEIAGGHVVYADAFEGGADMLVTSDAVSTELLALVRAPKAHVHLAWSVGLSDGLGAIRKDRDGGLEVVGNDGQVQLRVLPAYAIDARGTRRDAQLGWDATHATLSLDLESGDLVFPILVDPVVTTAIWTDQAAIDTTSSSINAGMAYDSARGQLVLLGSKSISDAPVTRVLDARLSGWMTQSGSQVLGSAMPTRENALVFDDPVSHKVMVFGGSGWTTDFDDTWRWDGFEWTKPPLRNSSPPPTTTNDGPAVYHEVAKRTVIWTRSGAWSWTGSDWLAPSGGPAPSSRSGVTMSYDADHGRIVLFGGRDTATKQLLDDTWLFDGATWTKADPKAKPPPREGGAMAYDPPRKQVVMFGGSPGLGDTWTWNGTEWTEREDVPANRPDARDSANVFAYDPDRQVIVLSGGYRSATSTYLGDTWTWNGGWTQRSGGTPPPARFRSAAGYDRAGKRLVVSGGQFATGSDWRTWIWDGQTWTELVQREPPARALPTMAYDGARRDIVMVGGIVLSSDTNPVVLSDTWTWDGSWKQETSPASLAPRVFAGMVYDAHASNVVLFGGVDIVNGSTTPRADTWVWNGAWTQVTTTASPAAGVSVLVYDEARQNVFTFEGAGNSGAAVSLQNVSNKAFTWDGAAWHPVTSSAMPPARCCASIVYDRTNKQIVLFGGVNRTGTKLLDDTWLWDGTEWTRSQAVGPSARAFASLAYDDANHEVLLFGGTDGADATHSLSDTWTWNGQAWTERPQSGTKPSPFETNLLYDPQVGRVIANADSSTWTWNGTSWLKAGETTTGAAETSIVYDEGRQNVLRFGGIRAGRVVASTSVLTFRGSGCQTNADCNTGSFCVDGVCCVQSSCATCERCDSSDRPGVCTPVIDDDDPDTCANERTCNAVGRCGLSLGKACVGAADCASGYCVDGVCCDSACEGQCEACDTSAVGLCRPSRGKPHGERPSCPGTDATFSSACDVPACDGTDTHRTSCAGTIGPCVPYLCAELGCSTSCKSDADCDPSATCDTISSRCRSNADAICIDDHTLFLGTDRASVDCRPYACAGNACNTQCTSIHDCASPNECSRDGVCVSPLAEARAADPGCSLVRSRPAESTGRWAILVAAALFIRRRRRRRDPPASASGAWTPNG
jgi:hypothetical protein